MQPFHYCQIREICFFSENQLYLDKVQKLQQNINILEEKLEVVKEEVKRKAEGNTKYFQSSSKLI